MISLQETSHVRRHRLVLPFEILEPNLDKFHHLPMDLLNLGRFLLRVWQSVLVPVMHPIYHGFLKIPSRRKEGARDKWERKRVIAQWG